jgi:hypothetical protein
MPGMHLLFFIALLIQWIGESFMLRRKLLPTLILIAGLCSMLCFGLQAWPQNNSSTDLLKAIRDGQFYKVDELLKYNSNLNVPDDYGWTPLMHAIFQKNLPLVGQLIAHGADVNLPDRDGITPLIAAIIQMPRPFMLAYSPESEKVPGLIAMTLIEKGADINKADNEGNTPLIYAIHSSQESIVAALIRRRADPNRADMLGRTPLYFAKNPDMAAQWAPRGGALTFQYRLRGSAPDESHFSPEYAAKVAEARRDGKVLLEQIKGRITELLIRVGATAPVLIQSPDATDPRLDSDPQQLGANKELLAIVNNFAQNQAQWLRQSSNGEYSMSTKYDVMVRIMPDGTVSQALVLNGLPGGFSESIQAAAMKTRYQPAMKNSQPVETWFRLIGGIFNSRTVNPKFAP